MFERLGKHKDFLENNYLHYLMKRKQFDFEVFKFFVNNGILIEEPNKENYFPISYLPVLSEEDKNNLFQYVFKLLQKNSKNITELILDLCKQNMVNEQLIIYLVNKMGNDVEMKIFENYINSLFKNANSPSSLILFLLEKDVSKINFEDYFSSQINYDPDVINKLFDKDMNIGKQIIMNSITEKCEFIDLKNKKNVESLKLVLNKSNIQIINNHKIKTLYSNYTTNAKLNASHLLLANKTLTKEIVEYLFKDLKINFFHSIEHPYTPYYFLIANDNLRVEHLKVIDKLLTEQNFGIQKVVSYEDCFNSKIKWDIVEYYYEKFGQFQKDTNYSTVLGNLIRLANSDKEINFIKKNHRRKS